MSSENGESLRDKILGAEDLQTEAVEVPEWGCTVHVRGMSGTERDEMEGMVLAGRNGSVPNVRGIKAALVVRTARDADGALIFRPIDAVKLNQKSSRAIDELFGVAQRLSGITDDDVEELEKNSEAAPSDNSGSR